MPDQFDESMLLERERLRLDCLNTLSKIAVHYYKCAEYQHALPYLQRLWQMEPLDESTARLLMCTYAGLGQRGAAMGVYDSLVRNYWDELGVIPDSATQSLAASFTSTHSPALSTISLPEDSNDPARLWQYARTALHHADRSKFEASLKLMQSLPDHAYQAPAQLLRIDYALNLHEHNTAEMLLSEMDAALLAVQVRQARLLSERNLHVEAGRLVNQVLVALADDSPTEVELETLLVLGRVQRLKGEPADALATFDRVIRRGRRLDSQDLVVRAQIEQGWVLIRQFRLDRALTVLCGAQALASEFYMCAHYADSTAAIATVQNYQGHFIAALKSIQEALRVWRDLDAPLMETKTLQRMSIIYGQLGRNLEAVKTLESAQVILSNIGDHFASACNLYHLASALPYFDESQVPRAIALAEEALAYFSEHENEGWQASALATLGYNLLLGGHFEEALTKLRAAQTIHEKLGEGWVLPELKAYQALALVGLNKTEEALEMSQQALLGLKVSSIENDIISEIYFAHAMVLEAMGNETKTVIYLERAYQNLLVYAEPLDEELAREAFFRRDPTVRRLMEAVYLYRIAQPPSTDIIRSRTSSHTDLDSYSVKVRLTVDSGPPDLALKRAKGSIELRRTRLMRFSREAEQQGAKLTNKQLADILQVSERTIKRDKAALRTTPR
jgi:tetratricopeptide (TPR) repeat protein